MLPATMADGHLPDLETFRDRVYYVTRRIPAGRVATYGDIALLAGSPRAARAVGQALNRLLGRETDIPWQRVINADGRISIRDEMSRARRQRRRLRDEGIEMTGWSCDLATYRWQPERPFWSNRRVDSAADTNGGDQSAGKRSAEAGSPKFGSSDDEEHHDR